MEIGCSTRPNPREKRREGNGLKYNSPKQKQNKNIIKKYKIKDYKKKKTHTDLTQCEYDRNLRASIVQYRRRLQERRPRRKGHVPRLFMVR